MHRGFYVCTLLLLTGAAADASPKLEVPETKADIGKRPFHEMAVHTFLLRNIGTSDLQILDAKRSCGCTYESHNRSVVKPGQAANVTIGYAPRASERRIGPQTLSAVLTTNDPVHRTLKLEVQAYLEAPVMPSISAIRGQIPADANDVSGQLDLWLVPPATITGVSCSLPEVTLQQISSEQDAERRRYHYRWQAKMEKYGSLNGQITITTTSPLQPRLVVPVRIMHTWPLKSTPERLIIAHAALTGPRTDTLLVEAIATPPPTTIRAACPDPGVSVAMHANPEGTAWRAEVSLNPAVGLKANTVIQILDPASAVLLEVPILIPGFPAVAPVR